MWVKKLGCRFVQKSITISVHSIRAEELYSLYPVLVLLLAQNIKYIDFAKKKKNLVPRCLGPHSCTFMKLLTNHES